MSWMSISVVNARKNLNAAALAQLRSFVQYSSQGVSNSKRLSGFKTQNINNQNCVNGLINRGAFKFGHPALETGPLYSTTRAKHLKLFSYLSSLLRWF